MSPRYRHRRLRPTALPRVVLRSTAALDPDTANDVLKAWRRATRSRARILLVDGTHFTVEVPR